jgi:ferric-dicitrate binding protein FerR (iron transport regulator)
MPDLIDQTRREIAARLQQLKPQHDEYERLHRAMVALDGIPAVPAPKRTPAPKRAPAPRKRRARPKGTVAVK